MPEGRGGRDLPDIREQRLLERQGETGKVSQTGTGGSFRCGLLEEIARETQFGTLSDLPQGSRPALSGKPASRHAFMPPSSATAR